MKITRRTIKAVDLFCGAGGTSTGLRLACEALGHRLQLVAINHWDIAIETHSKNHPKTAHYCSNIDLIDPRKAVPGGKLDLLVASPECIHHSIARGGKPINDQSRASAWRVVEWASQLDIKRLVIENVKEFQTWGPIGTSGRPLKRRKGETYIAFLRALESLGYTVEARILNAADFGDPTSRERLFIQAKKGRGAICWPEPTHAPKEKNSPTLFTPSPRLPHRPAREIIDWSIPAESIFTRKRPLAPATMQRIAKGLERFCGIPFTMSAGGPKVNPRSVDSPINTVLTRDHLALVRPFLVKYYGGADAQSVDQPLPTVTANYEHYGLAQPFVVELRNNKAAASIDTPLSTVCTSGAHHGLCQPFLFQMDHGKASVRVRSVENPMPVITSADAWALVRPFITRFNGSHKGASDGQNRNHNIDEPLPTLDTSNRFGLVRPYIIPTNHGKDDKRSHSIDRPMPSITTVDAWALIEPFLVKYNGTGGAMSVEEPLDTVTAKDRFGLVDVKPVGGEQVFLLDVYFRMLQPHELAAAMGFPKEYFFFGNREQKVRQIGNAVPVNLAKALCMSALNE